jgi:hypothetical protein
MDPVDRYAAAREEAAAAARHLERLAAITAAAEVQHRLRHAAAANRRLSRLVARRPKVGLFLARWGRSATHTQEDCGRMYRLLGYASGPLRPDEQTPEVNAAVIGEPAALHRLYAARHALRAAYDAIPPDRRGGVEPPEAIDPGWEPTADVIEWIRAFDPDRPF